MKHSRLFRSLVEKSILGVAFCGLLLLPGAPILCAQTYTVTDLGTLDGGELSAAYGINNDLGTLGGPAGVACVWRGSD